MTSAQSNLVPRAVGEASNGRAGKGFEGPLRPLSERILVRLPGPNAARVAWALLPRANAGANLLLEPCV